MNFLLIVLAYLIGAIPFSLMVARAKGVDLRSVGSGNPGATNVSRALGAEYGVFVLILDTLKGLLPVALLPYLSADALAYSSAHSSPAGDGAWNPDVLKIALAVAAVVGHVFPVYLGFRGGKGVATGLGVSIALMPLPSAIALVVFLAIVLPTRYVALGSVAAAIVLPLAFLFTEWDRAVGPGVSVLIGASALAVVIVVRHRSNLGRLWRGEETKFRFGSREESAE